MVEQLLYLDSQRVRRVIRGAKSYQHSSEVNLGEIPFDEDSERADLAHENDAVNAVIREFRNVDVVLNQPFDAMSSARLFFNRIASDKGDPTTD
ncbi:hypothetical protein ACP70R_001596 [Stipagrostis hirtigluma subsp. patula]